MSSPGPLVLRQLHQLDRSSPGFHDQLCNILRGLEYEKCVRNLQDDDLEWFVEYLGTTLGDLDHSSPAFRRCLSQLRRVCGASGKLPTSCTLSSDHIHIGPSPFASGAYGDVYEGTLDGLKVCVKRVRVYTGDDPEKIVKAFCREAVTWKHMTHPNVLPLLGIAVDPLQLVSNWMSGGALLEYIESNPQTDRLGLLSDVARGLSYLHSCNVIHGDLKGPNVLVDGSGRARITDSGLAVAIESLDSGEGTELRRGHTARWTAPEVLDEKPYSKKADIFSFAMVMIEVFTGAVPFNGGTPLAAIMQITYGRRPSRPTHPTFTEDLWKLMQRCWDQDPHLRPEVSEVLRSVSVRFGDPTFVSLTTSLCAVDF